MVHFPALQKEVLQFLEPKPNENFIDCTIGFGGHALAILEKTFPGGKLLGIDVDPEVIKNLELKTKSYKKRIILVCDNFANLKAIVKENKFFKINGILLDLGMSSWHLERSGRGFSFLRDEPLDMRYSTKSQIPNSKIQNDLTAEKIVNEWPQAKIQQILEEYGEEKFARNIAKKVIEERKIRPIKTTFELVKIIKKAVPLRCQYQRIHCATRTFQAIRIIVNKELDNLKRVLPQTLEILPRGGKLVIISFHSLEDRIVKKFFKENALKNRLKLIIKKPIIPSKDEIKTNPRSRSAKLRAVVKICPKQISS